MCLSADPVSSALQQSIDGSFCSKLKTGFPECQQKPVHGMLSTLTAVCCSVLSVAEIMACHPANQVTRMVNMLTAVGSCDRSSTSNWKRGFWISSNTTLSYCAVLRPAYSWSRLQQEGKKPMVQRARCIIKQQQTHTQLQLVVFEQARGTVAAFLPPVGLPFHVQGMCTPFSREIHHTASAIITGMCTPFSRESHHTASAIITA